MSTAKLDRGIHLLRLLPYLKDEITRPAEMISNPDDEIEALARELGVRYVPLNLREEVSYKRRVVYRQFAHDYKMHDNPLLVTDGLIEPWDSSVEDAAYDRRVMKNLRQLFEQGVKSVLWPYVVTSEHSLTVYSFPSRNDVLGLIEQLIVFGITSHEFTFDEDTHLWIPKP